MKRADAFLRNKPQRLHGLFQTWSTPLQTGFSSLLAIISVLSISHTANHLQQLLYITSVLGLQKGCMAY